MNLIESLTKVGFTRHESLLYLTLCKEGEITGYEAAKLSGIPRSNAYLALAGLVDKGGAYRCEEEAVKYTAVPVIELVCNLRRDFEAILCHIEKEAPNKELPADGFITITGQKPVIQRVTNMIDQAEHRIYIALSALWLERFRPTLEAAIRRELKVVVITEPPYDIPGASIYHHQRTPGSIRLITDSTQVLTGLLSDAESSCVYSKNSTLVHLIKESLTNEIKLIRIESDCK